MAKDYTLSEADWAGIVSGYDAMHTASRDLQLLPFYRFFGEGMPIAFAGYRQWAAAMVATAKAAEEPIPFLISNLAFLHYYALKGYEAGVLHEVELVRKQGVSKAQVWEALAFAAVHAGTSGMNAMAQGLKGYMDGWTDNGPSTAAWPASWVAAGDRAPIRIGLDYDNPDVTSAEVGAIRDWHRRVQGEVPPYVDFQLEFDPRPFKAFRFRYEAAAGGALPRQMFPIFLLQYAAMAGRPGLLRRALHEAKVTGVSRAQAMLMLSVSQVYLGDANMDLVAETAGPVLRAW